MVPRRKSFTDTITRLDTANHFASDDSGERKLTDETNYVTKARYDKDMGDMVEALKLLKGFQDRTEWSVKLLMGLFTGACIVATAVAALVGAFKHG